MIGQTLGHYRIESKIGEGGMGVVFKAHDTHLDRPVAIKVLNAEAVANPERKRRFVQEAKAASALNHPNIIHIYDIGTAASPQGATDFIAMEFVAGSTLDRMAARKGLALGAALKYAVQIADGLAAAHSAGIVHRDIKPANIMATEQGHIKLLDFGLAKLSEVEEEDSFDATLSDTPHTEQGTIIGTVTYMSPEQAEGKKIDARSDIFSFGAVLYELVTGVRAFQGETKVATLSAILHKEPKPFSEVAPSLPHELDRIILHCMRKDPARRFQHIEDVKTLLEELKEESESGRFAAALSAGAAPARRPWLKVAAPITAALAVLATGVAWWFLRGEREAPRSNAAILRLTSDTGLTTDPALSRDGKLVAYSSDRSLDGQRDLYMKQVAGGQPIRLTTDGAGNRTPDFSPDGSRIVFRSNREGGGIYEIPAFGGEARLVARDGLNPKYSPDGSQVAYWVGGEGVAEAVPGSGAVWVVPVAGGPPQRVGPNLTAARYPIWSPDGRHLLLVGYASERAYENSSLDWWLVATNGGAAAKTGAYEAMVRAGLRHESLAWPACWVAATNTVVFSAASGDANSLFAIGISPGTGRVSGALERWTTGAGDETSPSCTAGGALAFTKGEARRDVWTLPIDLNRGSPKGALERITQSPAYRYYVSLSNNGRHVAFASDQSGGPPNIWIRDLVSGKESIVASSHLQQGFPIFDASGARIAFSEYEKDKRVVYVSAPAGVPEKLCEGCLRATDWSRDEKTLLIFGGSPYQISVLDVASHEQTPLLKHPTRHLVYGRFSPDNRWVSFTIRTEPNRGLIAVAPIDGPKPVPESAWITITPSGTEDWADWSPDAKTLYFTSSRDGNYCLWGQRLDAASHRPVGDAFAVQHLHGRVSYRQGGWSAAGGRIAFVLAEETGNIWMMSRSSAP